jgi:hypothetical protein
MTTITDEQRGTNDRATATANRSLETDAAAMWTKLEMVRTKPGVFRYSRPDGSPYEIEFHKGLSNDAAAKAWADIFGHKLLGEVPTGDQSRPTSDSRGLVGQRQLSPPPLVQAEPTAPPPHRPPSPPPPSASRPRKSVPPAPPPKDAPPKEPKRITPVPRINIDRPGFLDELIDYGKHEFLHTTMTESMPLIAKWFGRVGKALEYVPPLRGVGKGYEAIGEIAEGLQLIYELINDVNQAEAFEQGSTELIKRSKPVKAIAERLLKKKYPQLPEPARKKLAALLEEAFEKYGADPAIKKGVDKARELDEGKDLNRTLYDQLRKSLTLPLTPR